MKKIFKQEIIAAVSKVYVAVALSAGGMCLATPAQAQTFPDHEINLIVNYGAGGNTDVATRALGQGMEKILGKPVVIQNKPGALGTLTPAYIARQKPDGYQVGVVEFARSIRHKGLKCRLNNIGTFILNGVSLVPVQKKGVIEFFGSLFAIIFLLTFDTLVASIAPNDARKIFL